MLDRPNLRALPSGQETRDLRRSSLNGLSMPYGRPMDGFLDEDDGFDPLQLLFYVVKYRWFLATMVVIGLVAGLFASWIQTPLYRATARVEIMVPSARVFQDLEVVSEASSQTAYQTSAEKLKSRSLAQRVVFETGLATKADFLFPRPTFSLSNLFSKAFGSENTRDINDIPAEQRENIAISRIQRGTDVDLVRGTSILAISYSSPNPADAKDVANQLAQSFIDQRVDQTSQTSELARNFIQEQVLQTKEKLATSEKALVEYSKKEGITVTGEETSLIGANIEAINKALSDTIQKRLELQRLVQQIDEGKGEFMPDVIEAKGISDLNSKLVELRSEYQQKRATFKPGFPEMKKLEAQIREMERQLKGAIDAITSSIRLKYQTAVASEADLRLKLNDLQSELAAYEDKKIQYTILKRDVDSNRLQYESLIGKLNEVGVGSELKSANANIIDAAILPTSAYSPRLTLNLGAALAIMLGLAVLGIYILELLNNTFSTAEQVENELKLPVLGILPKTEPEKIPEALDDPKSNLSEAYRSLRTAMQMVGSDGMPRSLLITSSEPSEGKSTTALKLGTDFAALGRRVLIIDADLRKPNIHRQLGYDNAIGLSNVLTGTVSRENSKKILRSTRWKNLTVMTAGTVPPNPVDLLSSARLGLVLSACLERFDLIIIDSPPIVGLSDAPILSRMVDKTVLTISANQVSRKSAAAALKRLSMAGASVAGAVLSKFSTDNLDYKYSYKYMSYNYYSYGSNALEGNRVHRFKGVQSYFYRHLDKLKSWARSV